MSPTGPGSTGRSASTGREPRRRARGHGRKRARAGAPPRSSAAAAGERRRALLDEGAHALGIVGGEACLALRLALEVELAVEIVAPGLLQHALGEREPDRGRRGEV